MDKEQKKEIGKRLRALREKKGMFQQDVADRVGVDRASISNYEIGRASPPGKILSQLADVFHTSVDYILGNTDNSAPLDEKRNNLMDSIDSKTPSNSVDSIVDDPKIAIFFKDFLDAPKERREEMLRFWEFINGKEKGRKPEDKQ